MSPGQFLTIGAYEININCIATVELQHQRQAQGQIKGGGTDVRIWLDQRTVGGYLPAYAGQAPLTPNNPNQLPPYIDLGGRDSLSFRTRWNHMRELGIVLGMTTARETTGGSGPTTNTATKAPAKAHKRPHTAKAAAAAA